ncbi:hypothetical protein ACFL20_11630, partial [Spirochaetota bacterium]
GNDVTDSINVTSLFNVDSTYVIIVLNWWEGYLVRKTDGAVFSLRNAGAPSEYPSNNKIYTDSSGNIYYLRFPLEYQQGLESEVVKLNVQDPENIKAQTYSPPTDNVKGFIIDDAGNMLYNGYLAYNYDNIRRLKMTNNSIYNSEELTSGGWKGLDGNIYYAKDGYIKKMTIDSNFNVTISNYGGYFNYLGGTKVEVQGRILLISYDARIFEVDNPTQTPRIVTPDETIDIKYIQAIGASDNYYYIYGENSSNQKKYYRINPLDDNATEIILPNLDQFDIFKEVISSDGSIVFHALRFSDSKKVIGKIDTVGNLSIIDESSNPEIITLIRIN